MLSRLIIQSWRRNPRRKGLVVATVFLAAALVSALLSVSIGIGDKMAKELKSYGANILMEPTEEAVLPRLFAEPGALSVGRGFLSERDLPQLKSIFWRHNIVGFAPLLAGQADADGAKTRILGTFFHQSLPVEGEADYRTGQKIIAPYWQVSGAWPDDEKNEALAGATLAAKMHWRAGQTLTLNQTQPVTISGILESGGDEDNQLVMPLKLAQRLLGLDGKIQAVRVSAMTVPENRLSQRARANRDALTAEEYDVWYCTAYVSSIAHQLEEAIPEAQARPIWQVAASEGLIVEKVQLLLIVATGAALLAASMGIASLMASTIMERAKEIALMKALAARPWQIMLLFYAEAAVSAVLGGLLGCGAGWLLARQIGWTLFGAPLGLAWIVVPSVLLLSVLIAVLGTWFPVRQIARLYPAEVLHGRR
ncbi:MAG: ABC transporter permease [Verrucomicrobiales bacterium]|jgi:putative ABC transport system permease protein|nr:ABC transporter permease [Verrucomicrobiales bacterium]